MAGASSIRLRNTLLAFALTSTAGLIAVVTAGPLDPPAGPIAPNYKTLEQVEPRIPIGLTTTPGNSTSTYRITQPGSYYLTGNITGQGTLNGISIAASNVTIDLNGFTLTGSASLSTGIIVEGPSSGLTVRNGSVRNWKASGIDAFNAIGSTFERITCEANGWAGMTTGKASFVRSCEFRSNGTDGLYAYSECLITDCISLSNGGDGMNVAGSTTVSRCTSDDNAGDGIDTTDGVKVTDSTFDGNTQAGIRATWRCTITGNTVFANGLHGILAGNQSRIVANNIESNGNSGVGYGILVDAASQSVTIADNSVTGNDVGIKVDGTSSFVVRNFVRANASNFAIAAGNIVGPTVTAANIAAQTNPSANYSN